MAEDKKHPAFADVQAEIQRRYQAGAYAEALELAEEQAGNFPEQAPLFYYWRMSMAARLGDFQQSLAYLQEVLDQGHWYGEVLLRKSPSLQPLQGLAEFERLVELNRQQQSGDETLTYPLLTLRSQGACQAGGPVCPFLLALHGNASTARESVEFWQPAASAGWLVAVPQSSQAMWKGAYVWDDLEVTRREIQHHAAAVLNQYAADPGRAVSAGHSMGGEAAIWLALTGAVAVRGFIAIGPGGPFTDEPAGWEPYIEQGRERGLRGYVITGEADENIRPEEIQEMVNRLNEAGIPCDLEEVPGARHDDAEMYASALLRGLDYILDEEN